MTDLILACGDIITMDPRRPAAAAVAIAGATITAVGDRDDIRGWRGDRTQVIDLGGATLTPPGRTVRPPPRPARRVLHDMATAGLTGAHVMDLDQDALTLYDALDADGQLPLHEPDCHGQSTAAYWKDPGDYTEAVRVLAQAGVQIATHAIGGAGVQHVLDTLAQVTPTGSTSATGSSTSRHSPRTRCRASPSSVSSPPCSPATPPSTPSPITATTGPGASMTSGPTGPGAAATSSTPAPSSLWAQTGQSHPMTPGTSGVGCSCPFSTCVR